VKKKVLQLFVILQIMAAVDAGFKDWQMALSPYIKANQNENNTGYKMVGRKPPKVSCYSLF
jgi:hypothetical protein